jgi:hypothetical protein
VRATRLHSCVSSASVVTASSTAGLAKPPWHLRAVRATHNRVFRRAAEHKSTLRRWQDVATESSFMGQRQKEWARKERRRIKALLGNRCQVCGSVDGLEFDCNRARGSKHHGMDTSQRMCFYRAQLRMGNLALLCGLCNSLKGDRDLITFMRIRSNPALLNPVNNTNNTATSYASSSYDKAPCEYPCE